MTESEGILLIAFLVVVAGVVLLIGLTIWYHEFTHRRQ